MARYYEVSPAAITQFARRHAEEIEELKANADAELNKLWIAQKAERVREYQQDVELNNDLIQTAASVAKRASERADELGGGNEGDGDLQAAEDKLAATVLGEIPSLQRIKHKALRSVAEELGQLPSTTKMEFGDNSVKVELVGVDLDEV